MAERGVDISHTTILRWFQHYVPEFEKRWNCYACSVGTSWRVDETHIRGRLPYLYCAVDKQALTVDFLMSKHRDIVTAKCFFTRAIDQHNAAERITLDGYPATHAAVAELKNSGVLHPQMHVRISKYLNNLIEQDHRRVKQRIYPMLGLKSFGNTTVMIIGVELAQKIRKGQFNTEKLTRGMKMRRLQMWEAVLAV
jgi:transposase-like protein